ncbi:MAG TPA: hypothetical protein VNJ52_03160 [Patescibacteria group bacterium]|nr:hypothetical protein [Patescibacteria group bacterium]
MRLVHWIAWFALPALILPAAAAQRRPDANSVRVGRAELSLGMPQKTVLGGLGRQFHVEHARGAGDDWAVIDHGKTIAIVSFSADKLSRVSKTWMTTGERNATALADRLYSLAGEFTAQERTACTLAAKPYKVAEVEGRIVTLSCGNKSIQIIQSRTPKSAWVTSLQEVLQ